MIKPSIKIDFVDFWPTLIKDDNYIYHLLSRVYTIEITDNPEVLFFSCFGKNHLLYNFLKIYYCGENKRPDFSGCDYALTYDLINHPRHFRWPLYAHHIDYENAWEILTNKRTIEQSEKILQSKNKFCCMVVSNRYAKDRINLFNELSKYKKVDSGGKYLNNVGGAISNKIDFIKDYKFVFAFENSSYPGYTTEKIIQPFIVNSIPIYWGNPKINMDFNNNAFINANSISVEELIEKIVDIDNNDDLAVKMLNEPAFPNNRIPNYADENKVIDFLKKAIDTRLSIKFVSSQIIKKQLHYYNLKISSLNKKYKRLIR